MGLRDMLRDKMVVNEINADALKGMQYDIGMLFPEFKDRVKAVGKNGGVNLIKMERDRWTFKVASGTDKKKSYKVVIQWPFIVGNIEETAMDSDVWNKDETRIDLRKLAGVLMFDADVETECTCPADLYWGGQYIRTQVSAKAGDPEKRPPDERNPLERGAYCKHTDLVMQTYPFYIMTFAGWLKRFYAKDIARAEQEVIRRKRLKARKEEKPR